jgi:hypothetical protein
VTLGMQIFYGFAILFKLVLFIYIIFRWRS